MKRVYMTRFGPDDANCLTACIASLLECAVEEPPCFSCMGTDWHRRTTDYLQARGWGSIFVDAASASKMIVSDCLCIAIMSTGTPDSHAVICRWHSEFIPAISEWQYSVVEVFDPHPCRSFPLLEFRAAFLVFPSCQLLVEQLDRCA